MKFQTNKKYGGAYLAAILFTCFWFKITFAYSLIFFKGFVAGPSTTSPL